MGEEISFNWEVSGLKKEGVIIFGDGNSEEISSTGSRTSHSYANQGKYSVKLILYNHFGTPKEMSLEISLSSTS